MELTLSELARMSQQLLNRGLDNPGPLTFSLVFTGGFLTSLGPCSLSLLPVTVAYLAGFENKQSPLIKSFTFCSGIVLSLVLLGIISSFAGRVYGQVPSLLPTFVAIVAILMGLNLLGIFKLPLPVGPDPNKWKDLVPQSIAPIAAGLAFGLASSPCTTPVIAVLIAWIAQSGNPFIGIFLLICFGFGQIVPLLLAGTVAGSLPKLLELRALGQWVPPISGTVLLITGLLTLASHWI